MAIQLSAPRTTELKPRSVVFGIGGAGGNAVNNMIEAGLEGVEFVVANTDAQQLAFSKTDRRIQLGVQVTQGLGAGAHPEVGMSAAEVESFEYSYTAGILLLQQLGISPVELGQERSTIQGGIRSSGSASIWGS